MKKYNFNLLDLSEFTLVIFGEQNIKGPDNLDPYIGYVFKQSTSWVLLLVKSDELEVEFDINKNIVKLFLLGDNNKILFREYCNITEFYRPNLKNINLKKGNYLYFEEKDINRQRIIKIDEVMVNIAPNNSGELTLDRESDIFIERTMIRTNKDEKVNDDSVYNLSISCTAFVF